MKAALVSITLISLVLSNSLFAQSTHSVQFNGGIIMPMSSTRGLQGTLQYNYKLNPKVQFYITTGYAAWNYFNIYYHADLQSSRQRQQVFKSHSANDHELIPLYLGTRINLQTNNWLTSFVNFEFGYSHFSYYRNKNFLDKDPDTGVVYGFFAGGNIAREVENLFGAAIGVGISHPLTKSSYLIFTYKVNSFVNVKGNSILSTRSTNSSFSAGFDFNI